MRVRCFLLLLAGMTIHTVQAQNDTTAKQMDTVVYTATAAIPPTINNAYMAADFPGKPSPYRTSFRVDGPILLGGLGLSVLGYKLIVDKKGLTALELAAHDKDDVPFFDRGNVGYYSESADKASYVPFNIAFGLPVLAALIDKNQRKNFVQVTSLYLEAMAIAGATYTLTAGLISRSRPLVYSTEAPYDKRVSNNSQRSFFAGHVSASATASFFAAQVFSDFNPGSKAKPYVWIVAAAIPAVVAYYRYEAGMHFLSDIVLGYGLGMATGILVPKLHRTKAFRNLSVLPQAGKNYKGLALVYKL